MQRNVVRNRRGLAVAIALALGCDGAQAVTITVNDAGDSTTAGICTLRQAIVSSTLGGAGASNCADGTGNDTIVFAGALAGQTITLSQGALAVSKSVTIVGTGQTIDASHAGRVFAVASTGTLTASHVTIANGLAPTDGVYGYTGGGIQAIGGATVDLSYVTVLNNTASDGAGGIAALTLSSTVAPTVTLRHCTVTGNATIHRGGAIAMLRLPNTGALPSLTISDSLVTGNHVIGNYSEDSGGGIYLHNGTATISRTTLTANSAVEGAAIMSSFSALHVVDSTLASNTSGSYGGGIAATNSSVSIANSTLYSNTANGGGGAISVVFGSTTTIVNSTISDNSAPGIVFYDNNLGGSSSSAKLYNTILANSGDDCHNDGASFTAASNLVQTAGCDITDGVNGNLIASPQFDGNGLSNHGGPTLTIALGKMSPALDAGDPALANDLTPTTSTPLAYDQRGLGYPRTTFEGTVDIGAYQHQGTERIFASGFEAEP